LLKEGSGHGASLCIYGSFLRGTLRGGGYFARAPEVYERKALRTGISLYGGSVRQPGMGLSTGDFDRWLKGALEVERPSLWDVCEGNLEGRLPWWGLWRMGIKGSGDGHLFPLGPHLGTGKEARLPETLRDGMKGNYGSSASL
jgi:hypothetical protein